MGIEVYKPRARVEIDGASRTLVGGSCTSGSRAAFSTATVILDPAEGRPTPGQTVRVWAGYDASLQLLFTGEIDAGGVTLAPNELEVRCTGVLSRTKERIGEPPTIVDGEAEQEYVALWEGVTAGVIIAGILDMYGITTYTLDDSGQTFGNIEPVGLTTADNGWSLIQDLDEVEGYKTYDGPDGAVIRSPFAGIPSGVGATFEQGIDLFAGRLDESRTGTYNRVIASGLPQVGSTGVDFVPTEELSAPSPWIPSPPTYRAFAYASPLFEDADQCGVYCARKLGELNRLRGEMPFDLALGDANIRPGMSIAVDSAILDIRANVRFWVIEVIHDLGSGFNTSGTLLMASEGTGWSPNQAPIAIIDATGKTETLADASTLSTFYLDGSASYDPELGVLGIVSYLWEAFGGGTLTAFDSAMRATIVYVGGVPDGAYVRLTVTDNLGKTGKSVKYLSDASVPLKMRDLISAELTRLQTTRDGGATWNSVLVSAVNIPAVGTCEFAAAEYTFAWTAAGALYKVLADDTATLVVGVADVTACAITLANGDTDLPTGRVWAGCGDGSVFRSPDDGATWEAVASVPNGQALTYIGESPFAEGDVEAAAGNVYYRTFDNGASWAEQFAHPNTALIATRVASGFGKGWAGFAGTGDDLGESRLQERDDAVELDADEPDKPINVVGLALDPFEDAAYVLDDLGGGDGRLFKGDTANGGNLTEMADWDDATWSTPRHLIRDGTSAGYLYIAADNYLLKSVDGLATVLELKELTGGAAGRMLGYGAETAAAAELEIVSTAGEETTLYLWDGVANDDPPAGWYAVEYDDSDWGFSFESTGAGTPLPGTMKVWGIATPEAMTAETLFRRTFTPRGRIHAATLFVRVDNFAYAVYVNGTLVAADVGTSDAVTTVAYDVASLILPGRRNVLAFHTTEIDGGSLTTWLSYRLVISGVGLAFVSTVGVGTMYAIQSGGAQLPEPSNWWTIGFDDSGWDATAAMDTDNSAFYAAPVGAAWLSAIPGSQSTGPRYATLYRHPFTLPAGDIAAATLAINADDLFQAVYLNGTLIPSLVGLGGRDVTTPVAPAEVALDPALLNAGGPNVLAVWAYSDGGGMGAAWRIKVG